MSEQFPAYVEAGRRSTDYATESEGTRLVAEEQAVALRYNSVLHSVMLASPADFSDFAPEVSVT